MATIHKRRLGSGDIVWELTHGTGRDRQRMVAGWTREEAEGVLRQFQQQLTLHGSAPETLTLTAAIQRFVDYLTGFVVNHPRRASVDHRDRDRVRAAVFQYELRCAQEGARNLKTERSLNGRIAHVRRCNTGAADRLQTALSGLTAKYITLG